MTEYGISRRDFMMRGFQYAGAAALMGGMSGLPNLGITEAEAVERGVDVEVGKFPWVGIGRAVAAGDTEGFIKVIRDKRYSEILGAHIVGPHATELIAEFVVGRHLEATVEEMERAMHPHPTLSEGVAEAALAALGRPIHI